MAKEVDVYIKLQVKGGQANPAPPIGPALGSKGVNIMEFCKRFNAQTQEQIGKILPVIISVYKDKTFDFIIKTPPASVQLAELTKKIIRKGQQNQVGRLVRTQPQKSGLRYLGSGACHRRRQNARLELLYGGVGHENDCRHGAQHGLYRNGYFPLGHNKSIKARRGNRPRNPFQREFQYRNAITLNTLFIHGTTDEKTQSGGFKG